MVKLYKDTQSSILGVYEIDKQDVSSYGIVQINKSNNSINYPAIKAIIEKPDINKAPSNLAVIGRYILTPKIMDELAKIKKGINGEIQLTDAISKLLKHEKIYAHKINGIRYDCGSKLGYLKATVAYALKHKELASEFRDYLHNINGN